MESVVEQAALEWLGGLGYEVLSGLTIAPGETLAEARITSRFFFSIGCKPSWKI
ncbi:MAG TPA: hypothetical protein VK633_15825 [Verrucomicrobiae bacterium]|nr:hypothetical protein [Verrucomicrobiae bacterium]